MKPLLIPETSTTPAVILDADKGIFEISGRSVADNPSAVYQPVMQWLNDYAREPRSTTLFVFKLEYFNTASSKALLDIISALYLIRNTKVLWYYREDDEYLKEAGEEFFELVNIPFEFKTY
jgi:hypothetical protein